MMQSVRGRVAAFAAALVLSLSAVTRAALIDAVWAGGSGNWNHPANWMDGIVPNNGADTYSVYIDDGSAVVSDVVLNMNAAIAGLTIDVDDSLTVDNAFTLRINAGTLVNAGTISLNSTGNNTYLRPLDGPITLSGGGTLLLSNSANNWIYQQNGGSLINLDNTIRGSGNLGWTSAPTNITNDGLIVADQPTALQIAGGTGSSTTNTGTFRAENGATLNLQSADVLNTDGVIEALDGSKVTVTSSSITGGTLQTTGSGAIEANDTASMVADLVNAGILRIPNSRRLYASGTINNTGVIELNSIGNATYLQPIDSPLTLTGGGTVMMSDEANNFIYRSGNGSLVNVNNTIRGSGRIGWTSAPTNFDNQAEVIADQATPLNLQGGTNSIIINTGVYRATNNATLQIQSATIQNDGGIIEALDGSKVTLGNTTIVEGTLQTTGTGVIESADTNVQLKDLVTTGLVRIPNSRRMQLSGTIHNSGTIELGAANNGTYLQPTGETPVSLVGGGTIAMSDSAVNWIYRSQAGSLINVDNTIRGSGNIGWISAPTSITNQGLIIADQPTPLHIAGGTNSTFTNSNIMRAENGATMELANINVQNADGVIAALDGSTVSLASATITGGTLQTEGSGAFASGNADAILDGTDSPVHNMGLYQIPNTRRLDLRGTIENSGVIELTSTGSATYIQPNAGEVMLTGGGEIILSDQANNWIYRSGDASLVNIDNTIRGAGRIGWSAAPMDITNHGTIIAEGANQMLFQSGSDRLIDNRGSLIVDGAGGLRIESNFTTSGDVTINETRTLTRIGAYTQTAGATVVNGTLSATQDVDIEGGILAGTGTVLDGVTNAGTVSPGNSIGTLTIDDTYVQAPTGELFIELADPMHDKLVVTGAASLDGALRLEVTGDPPVGMTYEIMTYASVTGEFQNFDVTCLPGGKSIYIGYTDTAVVATVRESRTADVDCDCALTAQDIELFVLALLDSDAYEAATPNCIGLDAVDLNDDSFVNGHDIQPFIVEFLP